MEIKTRKYGIIHGYAQCSDCDWASAIRTEERSRMAKLRSRIYAHIKKTQHKVNLETSNSTTYSCA